MRVLHAVLGLLAVIGSHGFVTRSPSSNRNGGSTSLDMSSGEGVTRRSSLLSFAAASILFVQLPQAASARLESVNRPDLLPTESGLNVIQTEKFLTSGQVRRMDTLLAGLEKDTGFRVRVLCQNYPNTPGLAIRDYWDLGKEVSIGFFHLILPERFRWSIILMVAPFLDRVKRMINMLF